MVSPEVLFQWVVYVPNTGHKLVPFQLVTMINIVHLFLLSKVDGLCLNPLVRVVHQEISEANTKTFLRPLPTTFLRYSYLSKLDVGMINVFRTLFDFSTSGRYAFFVNWGFSRGYLTGGFFCLVHVYGG